MHLNCAELAVLSNFTVHFAFSIFHFTSMPHHLGIPLLLPLSFIVLGKETFYAFLPNYVVELAAVVAATAAQQQRATREFYDWRQHGRKLKLRCC